jgi:hypothetical protein
MPGQTGVSRILGEFLDLTGLASQFVPKLQFQTEINFKDTLFWYLFSRYETLVPKLEFGTEAAE